MSNFYGKSKQRNYFEGWYFKQQNRKESVALIPAFHVNNDGESSASLQVITDEQAYNIDFQTDEFYADSKKLSINLGECTFSQNSCKLDLRSDECTLSGDLYFGPFAPLAYDIMGPFSMIPFMECRHSVFSMSHRVDGLLTINGKQFLFENSCGYLEGDRGVSFPKKYIWTHCNFEGNSIMLSVAEIPFGVFNFIGSVGFIYLNGKEHRIATYLGVKLLHISNDTVVLRQGKLILKIKMLKQNSHPLHAPQSGSMHRTIHESVSCTVHYTCSIDGETVFDFVSEQASFENNWDNSEPIKQRIK